ncbi:MAG: hypothetical protein Kow0068_03470 [Marinilabiliales bacterium]
MKNIKIILISIVYLFVAGCTKEEVKQSRDNTYALKEDEKLLIEEIKKEIDCNKNNDLKCFNASPYNPDNPYDSAGVYVTEALKYVNNTQLKYDSAFTYNKYFSYYKNYFSLYPYKKLEVNNLTKVEVIILNIYKEACFNLNLNLYIYISKITEDIILNSNALDNKQKERLLYVISILKHGRYFIETNGLWINGQYSTWEEDLDDCIEDELADIFNDDNYVDDVLFVIGCPNSFLEIVAYCAYEVTFG